LDAGLEHPDNVTSVSIRFVHRIKSAGMKGMATKKATQGKIQATKGSVMGKSLYGIL